MSDIGYTWFEYDCPVDGVDFDVEPLPAYGSTLRECACGQRHIATEEIGNAFRIVADNTQPGETMVECITDQWKSGGLP